MTDFLNYLVYIYRLVLLIRTMIKSSIFFLVLFVTFCNVYGDDESKDVGTVIGIDLGTTYSW